LNISSSTEGAYGVTSATEQSLQTSLQTSPQTTVQPVLQLTTQTTLQATNPITIGNSSVETNGGGNNCTRTCMENKCENVCKVCNETGCKITKETTYNVTTEYERSLEQAGQAMNNSILEEGKSVNEVHLPANLIKSTKSCKASCNSTGICTRTCETCRDGVCKTSQESVPQSELAASKTENTSIRRYCQITCIKEICNKTCQLCVKEVCKSETTRLTSRESKLYLEKQRENSFQPNVIPTHLDVNIDLGGLHPKVPAVQKTLPDVKESDQRSKSTSCKTVCTGEVCIKECTVCEAGICTSNSSKSENGSGSNTNSSSMAGKGVNLQITSFLLIVRLVRLNQNSQH
jgi:hypothetical protein